MQSVALHQNTSCRQLLDGPNKSAAQPTGTRAADPTATGAQLHEGHRRETIRACGCACDPRRRIAAQRSEAQGRRSNKKVLTRGAAP